jgi:hypothetical protein
MYTTLLSMEKKKIKKKYGELLIMSANDRWDLIPHLKG